VKVFASFIATTLGFTGNPQIHDLNAAFHPFASPLPIRELAAPAGQHFLTSLFDMDELLREEAILKAVLAGNIPDFLRVLVPVTIHTSNSDAGIVSITFWVMPDYLAVGSDHDYVRMPMNLLSAEKVAEAFNLRLPTRKMVDAIYQQADVKLRPRPMRPGPQMTSLQYYQRHHQMIEQDLSQLSPIVGQLVAGHKKDVVQSRRLLRKPGAIAIYGWHQRSGKPIQPLSTAHHSAYADYSHGIRMVANHVEIQYHDNRIRTASLDQVLADRRLCSLLSDEGQVDRKLLRLEASGHRNGKHSS